MSGVSHRGRPHHPGPLLPASPRMSANVWGRRRSGSWWWLVTRSAPPEPSSPRPSSPRLPPFRREKRENSKAAPRRPIQNPKSQIQNRSRPPSAGRRGRGLSLDGVTPSRAEPPSLGPSEAVSHSPYPFSPSLPRASAGASLSARARARMSGSPARSRDLAAMSGHLAAMSPYLAAHLHHIAARPRDLRQCPGEVAANCRNHAVRSRHIAALHSASHQYLTIVSRFVSISRQYIQICDNLS